MKKYYLVDIDDMKSGYYSTKLFKATSKKALKQHLDNELESNMYFDDIDEVDFENNKNEILNEVSSEYKVNGYYEEIEDIEEDEEPEDYDYYKEVKKDISNYIEKNYSKEELIQAREQGNEIYNNLKNEIIDKMFCADEVTGADIGRYARDREKTRARVNANDGLVEAVAEMSGENPIDFCLSNNIEEIDCMVRQFVVEDIADETIDEIQ